MFSGKATELECYAIDITRAIIRRYAEVVFGEKTPRIGPINHKEKPSGTNLGVAYRINAPFSADGSDQADMCFEAPRLFVPFRKRGQTHPFILLTNDCLFFSRQIPQDCIEISLVSMIASPDFSSIDVRAIVPAYLDDRSRRAETLRKHNASWAQLELEKAEIEAQ